MLEIIEQSFKEKIENGEFKSIADKKINEMFNACLDDMLKWNGKVKEYFKQQLEEIMMGVVKTTDFTKYCNIIKNIINKTLPETALPDYKNFVQGLILAGNNDGCKNFSNVL